ncbi:MAG TPA: SpvB/TcaC N-terminal domain-containing protein [Puia sp.]|nr:SpvB/TcaC N-terminal domain-containing protein [Puia sp.]
MQRDPTGQASPGALSAKRPTQLPAALGAYNDGKDFAKNNLLEIPVINLPKGGGALKSIDEKFQVNAANGTSAMSMVIPMSKSRSDFAPSLSLHYNSGSGNGIFGLGWNIDLPSIRRRTDKLLPSYRDAENSDVFQLAGAEDLVVKLLPDAHGNWQPDQFDTGNYQIRRFVPRIEGAFTLIEQIQAPGGMYWKTTSKANIVMYYGVTTAGRVADPADPAKIFEWLPEICYDDKGNCYQYFYVAEDMVNVPPLLFEGNRLNGNQAIANTYLKRVAYANMTPYSPTPSGGSPDPYNPVIPDGTGYLFNLVLDYGDHDLKTPKPTPSGAWGYRLDPFSIGKPGFDRRTYRLCRRFLMFHQFPELDVNPVLVRSLDLIYRYYDFQPIADPNSLQFVEADFIVSVTETGWTGNSGAGYQQASYPPLTFSYQLPVWNTAVETIDAQNRENIPEGLSSAYQFTDLYNEGIAGILSEHSSGWYYNSNLGEGVFTPASLIAPKPSFTGLNGGSLQLQSLTGDGRKFIVSNIAPHYGYFELTDDSQEWLPFRAFDRYPAFEPNDPNIKLIDLNGDGMPDVVLSEEQVFTWYPAAGIRGYDSPELSPKPFDEEKGPAIVFADPVQSIFLADMTGDGLTDIVRIRNGEISYWPNLGYGIFGAKVNMMNAPEFDTIDAFNPGFLHLADIDGTGATDILYLGQDKLRAWLNQSGNAWGNPFEAPAFPHTASPNQLAVSDFLGNGTACIIWSSPLAANADQPIQYIDLMGGLKPYLMSGYSNGMGKTVALTYRSSTYYYLQDKLAGTPWVTKLCFPVQCLAQAVVTESVSGTSYSSSYTYHHGYFDHREKEFRGFGRVDQTDSDIFDIDALADQTPMLTRTWYHTGAYFGLGRILHQFASEYFQNPAFTEYNLPEPELPTNMTAEEVIEAVRACKGMTIRQEVYALDASSNPTLAPNPYTVAEHNNNITLLQPRGPNEYAYAVFLPTESEAITYYYERNPADPRVAHTLNTAFNAYGDAVDSYSVVYARQPVDPAHPGGLTLPGNQPLPAAVMMVQQNIYVIYTHHNYTQAIQTAQTYRLPVACETIVSEVTSLAPGGSYFTLSEFSYPAGILTKLRHERTLFLKNDLVTPLPLTNMDTLGLAYQRYHLAFNAAVTALGGKATSALLQGAQYIESDTYIGSGLFPSTDASGEWWVPSGRVQYLKAGAPLPFLSPYQYLDPYNYPTTVGFDNHWLVIISTTDALNNTTTGSLLDYRILLPQTITDPNGNATDFKYDRLGLLVAIAMRGKGEGDVFNAGFVSDLTAAQIAGFFSDPFTNGPALLQGATMRHIYDFVAGGPFSSGTITRRIHANQAPDPRVDTTSVPYQYSFEYTDGLGRIAMQKVQADVNTGAATASSCDGGASPQHRWIGKGKTVYNNKGKPVMQYEPYFSTTPVYEEAPATGVSPVLHYDPAGRVIRTDFPDGSFYQTIFDGWVQLLYDQNDTVLDSAWYVEYSTSTDPGKVDAANKAKAHYNTPAAAHLDPLGRNFYTVAYNMTGGTPGFYATQIGLDLNNNPLSVTDAMGNVVMQWEYDLLNRRIHQVSMDAGERWMLHDVMNKPATQWDVNGVNSFIYSFTYDALHRALQANVRINGTSYLTNYNIYGENIIINGVPDVTNNLRGRLYRQFDDSGLVTHYLYDFKGNVLQSSRIFANAYKAASPLIPVVAWAENAGDMGLLSAEEYVSLAQYDVFNRPILQTRPFIPVTGQTIIPLPYDQAAVNKADVFIPGHGESGELNTVNLYYGGGAVATAYVTRICHNEKGQRLCIQYGNNTVTRYSYDPDTFRLIRLLTTGNTGTVILQDINYYYDPVGNITYQIDNAQPPVWYNNQHVFSDGDFTYDAIYRLISATGREQVAQNTVDENASNGNLQDYPFDTAPTPAPTDPLAMRSYTENYKYDAVGNMQQLQHAAGTGSYTRQFAYNNNAADRAAFGIPPAAVINNQLLATTIGGGPALTYSCDGHGNMMNLPGLPSMAWNYKDQFVSATQQAVVSGTGQTTYYTYDADGIRTRKVTTGATTGGGTAMVLAERLYIGNYEIYRTYDGSGNVTLQRETLHVMDDQSRIATIDNKTKDTAGSDPTSLNTYYPRYQYGNLIGSVAYELDGGANIVSYEEYHPFGTTSYQAASAALDVPRRRYRYTGKERDEESGLYYHGARYYACWLCRWISPDPLGTIDGGNRYAYVNNNPVSVTDPTGNGGEETNEVTPYLREVLKKYGIKFSEQVQFKVTNEAGEVITGFFDMVIIHPGTGKPYHVELKGLDKDALSTPGQEQYVKIFESKEGAVITYTGKKGGSLGLKPGDTFMVNEEAFSRVARGDMKGFMDEIVKAAGGKKILHSFYSDKEGWKTFTSDAEWNTFLKERGLGHLVTEAKPGGKGGGGNEGNGGGGTEKNATKDIETAGKDVENQVEKRVEKGLEKGLEKTTEKTLEKAVEKSLGRTIGEHIPIVGWIFAGKFASDDLDEGNYSEAGLDAVGPVPIVGEVAGGYQLVRDSVKTTNEVMTEELSIWDRGIRALYGGF